MNIPATVVLNRKGKPRRGVTLSSLFDNEDYMNWQRVGKEKRNRDLWRLKSKGGKLVFGTEISKEGEAPQGKNVSKTGRKTRSIKGKTGTLKKSCDGVTKLSKKGKAA